MLDIKFVRENPEIVKENIKKKFQDEKLPLVDEVIALDAENRKTITEAEALRAERNRLSKTIGGLMGAGEEGGGRAGQGAGRPAGRSAQGTRGEGDRACRQDPHHHAHHPEHHRSERTHRPDDSHNVEVQRFGEPVVPDFEIPYTPRSWRALDGIDLDSARRVAGNGFYYLLGDIARLHEAVLAYARDFMIDKKGFTYVIPPFMMHGAVVQGVMSFPEMDAMMYKIEGEDLYLIGTSEHTMIGRFVDQIIPEEQLPLTLTSYSPCFRKEKGSHGIEERGGLPDPPVRETGDDRRLPPRGEHGVVRQALEEQRRALPQHGHPGAAA